MESKTYDLIIFIIKIGSRTNKAKKKKCDNKIAKWKRKFCVKMIILVLLFIVCNYESMMKLACVRITYFYDVFIRILHASKMAPVNII